MNDEKCPRCGEVMSMFDGTRALYHEVCGRGCLSRQLLSLRAENRELNLALFHVENGINHPDQSVCLLIQAAHNAKEATP